MNVLVKDTGVECLVRYMKGSHNPILRKGGRESDIPTKWKKSSKKKKKKI